MSCSSSRSGERVRRRAPSAGSKSGSAGSLISSAAESMRTPSTPRSNQNRRTSSNSRRTSGLSQLRSGCSGANRCRYHSPGVPSGFVVRVQAAPPKIDDPVVRRQLAVRAAARAEPEAVPLGRARAGGERLPEPAVLVGEWLGTMSTMTRMPSACASRDQLPRPRRACRRAGRCRGSRRRRSRRRPSATGTRGEPDRVDAEVAQVGQARADAGEVADAVAVAVGEAAEVDLVDDGAAPPRAGRRLGVARRRRPCCEQERVDGGAMAGESTGAQNPQEIHRLLQRGSINRAAG